MKRAVIALAAAALLTACVKVNKSLPADAPPYAVVYPGATQVVSMDMMGMQSILFQVADTPDTILGYYRTQATSNGLQEVSAANKGSPEQKQASFRDPSSNRIFVVVARPKNGGTMVDLTYTSASKAAS